MSVERQATSRRIAQEEQAKAQVATGEADAPRAG